MLKKVKDIKKTQNGEFCLAILILKIKNMISYYYFKKDKNTTETQKEMICAVYGEGAITDQKWFAKFQAGDFSINNAPWSGRPVEVDSNPIETFIENDQHYTMQEIADILTISKSIKLLVKMKNVSFILWKKPNRPFGQPNRYMKLFLQ